VDLLVLRREVRLAVCGSGWGALIGKSRLHGGDFFSRWAVRKHVNLFNGMFVVDPLTKRSEGARCWCSPSSRLFFRHRGSLPRHVGEYLALILLATVGHDVSS